MSSPIRFIATFQRMLLVVAVLAFPMSVLVAAFDPPGEKADEENSARDARLEMMMRMAERYEIYARTDPPKKLGYA